METDASAAAVDDLKRNEDLKECVEKALEEREQKIKATRECLILLLLNVFRFILFNVQFKKDVVIVIWYKYVLFVTEEVRD